MVRNTLAFDPETHRFTLDGQPIPSVTRVLALLYRFDQPYEVMKISQAIEAARQRGRVVHQETEEYDRIWKPLEAAEGGAWRPESAFPEYLAAWRRFLSDTGFELHAIEEAVFSARHRYAGIVDRLGLLNGERAVLDIKTTAAINPETGIQLAAYQAATNEGRRKAEHYDKRFVCQLRPNGTYRLEEFKDRADFTVFLSLLTIHNWRARHQKGEPW